jgi:flagellar motor switch protein FliN/FliY
MGGAYGGARIRDEFGRAACDVVDAVLGIERRPAVELASGPDVLRLAIEGSGIEEALIAAFAPGFELRRGRSAVRAIRTGAVPIARNGWRLETGVPVTLRDGDTIEAGRRSFRVAYDAPQPRPQVAIGPARIAGPPEARGLELRFTLEPAAQPVVVACDGASARAVLDLVVGGCGERPFDRTPLAEVERAVVGWVVARVAHAAARAIAGTSVALRADGPCDREPDVWSAAAVRVGSFCGVWWLGTTNRALEALAPCVAQRWLPSLASNPAAAGLDVTVVARVALGRLTPDELAGLEPGDTIVSRCGATRGSDGLRGVALLCVAGAGAIAIAATLEQRGSTVRASIGGRSIDERSETMQTTEESSGPERPFEAALEDLRVTVCVEVARRRMPLAQLLSLGPGDVVELHAAVQNDVTLTVDGGAFARAELVDADGSLAVRILALGGPR